MEELSDKRKNVIGNILNRAAQIDFFEKKIINRLSDLIYLMCSHAYYSPVNTETWFVSKDGVKIRKHCRNFASRSTNDIYRICKNYYPEITFKQIWDTLYFLKQNGYVTGHYCSTVKKDVYSNTVAKKEQLHKILIKNNLEIEFVKS